MSLFARAWKSIIRQPIKSLVLLVTVAVLGTLIAGAVSLKQGIIVTQKEMESKMRVTGSIQPKEGSKIYTALDTALMEKIAALPQVQGYELLKMTQLFTGAMVSKKIGSGRGNPLCLTTYGAKNGALLDYTVGNLTLVSGRWLNAEDEKNSQVKPAVIPDDFARDNHLSIGSSFILDIVLMDMDKLVQLYVAGANIDTSYAKLGEATFSVVGTFEMADKYVVQDGTLFSPDKQTPHLDMYTSGSTVEGLIQFSDEQFDKLMDKNSADSVLVSPSFTVWLKDRQSADAFAAAVAAEGLPDQYQLVLSTETYDNTMAPLQNLGWIVNWIIVAAIVTTIAVLGLVVSLILKSRQLEMGILFALGDRKKRIVRQMATEILMVTLLGLTISAFVGYGLSRGIAGQMVKNEVDSMVVNIPKDNTNYDGNVLHSLSEGITPTLGADTFVWIYFTGLLTAGAATAVPVAITLRQSPKDILLT